MSKRVILIIIFVVLVLISAVLIFNWNKGKNENPQAENSKIEEIVLFYGDTCPHCKDLEEWISANKIAEKVKFSNLEVYNNQENKKLLAEKATICKLDLNSIGVPFLWTGTSCIIGSEPIEKFFQEKLNINTNITTNETNQ